MDATARADAIVADRLRAAADREPLPGKAEGDTAVDLARSLAAGSVHAERFAGEIASAVRGTALALEAARPHPHDLWAAAEAAHLDPSVWFEQAVLLGHPTHPLARSRGELTDDEIRAFAPEHRARFDLGRYQVPGLTVWEGWRVAEDREQLLPVRLPVHPWQARRRGLTAPESTWTGAAPLMSLRTVSVGDRHVKTAVDLQLTSAVRHVSAAAVSNGWQVWHRLERPAADLGITLVPERGAISRPLGPDYTWSPAGPDTGLAAIVRPAPHTLGHPRAVPLAALAEPDPATGRPIGAALAGNDLEQWWTALVAVALAPVRLFATTGVALEAHGQNTLASFTGNRPASLVYRDFGGIRVPTEDWPALTGDLPEPDPAKRLAKLLAALFPTTLTALVQALAEWTGTDPGTWWSTVAAAVRDLALDQWIAAAVLRDPWPVKATTAMRLADHATDDIWASVDNPLAAA
ncbi:IucA/IucC family protein [Glycomyces harbinensis]|uniref:Siderophore synthetase component n=1 Tax=Glycomyces harbinensis TaxID=58114 RepID=A0A1G6RF09_9ACTN|nr:IucA/IucC family protein [Glycomyces harbinensis]SDD02635.1 Siderophore synthetase component [Glycomyces harbinensis]